MAKIMHLLLSVSSFDSSYNVFSLDDRSESIGGRGGHSVTISSVSSVHHHSFSSLLSSVSSLPHHHSSSCLLSSSVFSSASVCYTTFSLAAVSPTPPESSTPLPSPTTPPSDSLSSLLQIFQREGFCVNTVLRERGRNREKRMARVVRVTRSSSSLFGFGSRFNSTTAASATYGVTQSLRFLHGGGARVPHIATSDLVREELASSGSLSQQFQTSHLCRCGLISSSRSLPELVTPPEPPEPPDPPDPPPARASPVPPLGFRNRVLGVLIFLAFLPFVGSTLSFSGISLVQVFC